jgi:transcription elongation factor GreB
MSKAFTKEDSAGEEPLLLTRPRPAAEGQRYITPEGYRALQEELGALERAPRTRERTLRERQLTAILDAVRVVEPEALDATRVFFGAWVRLEDDEGEETSYRIVGPDEADVKEGRLSVESPLARALLGKEEGESVRVERPRGAREYTLTQVSYRPLSS